MTTREAIIQCFAPNISTPLQQYLSWPELLNAAALECFVHYDKIPHEIQQKIREALIYIRLMGVMME